MILGGGFAIKFARGLRVGVHHALGSLFAHLAEQEQGGRIVGGGGLFKPRGRFRILAPDFFARFKNEQTQADRGLRVSGIRGFLEKFGGLLQVGLGGKTEQALVKETKIAVGGAVAHFGGTRPHLGGTLEVRCARGTGQTGDAEEESRGFRVLFLHATEQLRGFLIGGVLAQQEGGEVHNRGHMFFFRAVAVVFLGFGKVGFGSLAILGGETKQEMPDGFVFRGGGFGGGEGFLGFFLPEQAGEFLRHRILGHIGKRVGLEVAEADVRLLGVQVAGQKADSPEEKCGDFAGDHDDANGGFPLQTRMPLLSRGQIGSESPKLLMINPWEPSS